MPARRGRLAGAQIRPPTKRLTQVWPDHCASRATDQCLGISIRRVFASGSAFSATRCQRDQRTPVASTDAELATRAVWTYERGSRLRCADPVVARVRLRLKASASRLGAAVEPYTCRCPLHAQECSRALAAPALAWAVLQDDLRLLAILESLRSARRSATEQPIEVGPDRTRTHSGLVRARSAVVNARDATWRRV